MCGVLRSQLGVFCGHTAKCQPRVLVSGIQDSGFHWNQEHSQCKLGWLWIRHTIHSLVACEAAAFVRALRRGCLPPQRASHTIRPNPHASQSVNHSDCRVCTAWHTPVAANTRCAHGHLRTHQQASTQHNRHAGTGTTDTQAQAHAHAYIHTGTTDTQAHAHAHAYIHAGIHAR